MKSEIKKYKFKDGLPVEFEIIKISDLYHQHKSTLISPHRADFYPIIRIQQDCRTMAPGSCTLLRNACDGSRSGVLNNI